MASAIIVGAGIAGVTTALELRCRGWDVTLADPGPIPRDVAASTDISKAVRMDYGSDDLYMSLMEEAFHGWHAWNRRWGEELYHETGFLFVCRGEMQPGGFEHESFVRLSQRGHTPERLRGGELERRFPAWAPGAYADGYLNRKAGWAESGRVVAALARQCEDAGVRVEGGRRFDRLLEEGSRVTGIVSGGERLKADVVVMATGAWTPSLLPHLGDVMWATGQPVLHFRVPDPAAYRPPHFLPWAADISTTGWYGFAALPDGTLKVAHHGPGWRLDPDGPRTVPLAEEARFRAFLRGTFPGVANAPLIGTRVCFYCDTFDGNFWIDRDPDRPGLVVSTGDSGHGFKFAPMLGVITADVVEGRPNHYAPRFRWRPRGKLATEDARYTEGA